MNQQIAIILALVASPLQADELISRVDPESSIIETSIVVGHLASEDESKSDSENLWTKMDDWALLVPSERSAQLVVQEYVKENLRSENSCEGSDSRACFGQDILGATNIVGSLKLEGVRLFLDQACEGGVALACMDLAMLYEDGSGVPRSYPKALTLFGRACNGGMALACSRLGFLHTDGLGGLLDFKRARVLFKKACESRQLVACSKLGELEFISIYEGII